jgi:hypothetical protein
MFWTREGRKKKFRSSGDVTLDLVVSFALKPLGVQESLF